MTPTRKRGPPTDSAGYSLLSPVFPFSIPKFILIYASFPPWGSELEKEATPDPNSPLPSPTSRISVVFQFDEVLLAIGELHRFSLVGHIFFIDL